MRTVIFTCVMLILFWATDFAVLMWDLNPPGYDGYTGMIVFLWFMFLGMDIVELQKDK